MKRYPSVASLRAHLADALDAVEEDGAVEVERRGRTFRIVEVSSETSKRRVAPPPFFAVDRELLEKGWSWAYEPGEPLALVIGKPRRPARPRRGGR